MIPFTQFLRPDASQRPTFIERPQDIEQKAHELLDAKARLSCEELQTGEVSFTAEWDEGSQTHILAHRICPNGPGVPEEVDRLITRAHAALMDLLVDKTP